MAIRVRIPLATIFITCMKRQKFFGKRPGLARLLKTHTAFNDTSMISGNFEILISLMDLLHFFRNCFFW